MKSLRYITKGLRKTGAKILSMLGLMAMVSLSACSDREPVMNTEDEIPEGMTRITFLLPDYSGGAAKFGTRAFNPDEEGYMSNLYVIAIKYYSYEEVPKVDDTPGTETKITKLETPQVYTFALNPVGVDFKVGDKEYKQFNVTLFPGEYKFAVVANLDLYLSRNAKISDFTVEQDLRNIVLNFSEDTPLVPTHLPMVCLPEEIQYQHTKEGSNSYGDISRFPPEVTNPLVPIYKNQSARIYADMKFLCAKVRYTILFDKKPGGISEDFGDSWIRFNVDDTRKPTAHNLRRQTLVLKDLPGDEIKENPFYDPDKNFVHHDETTEDETGAWFVNIDRYNWHSEGKDYPKTPNSSLDLWTGSTEEWISQDQKVWQGIVYLPENTLENKKIQDSEGNEVTEIYKTYLEFPYHTKANSLDDTPWEEATTPKRIYLFGNEGEKHFGGTSTDGAYSSNGTIFTGLDRNYFYDVVAKVVNPDTEEMDIRVFVSILPWHEMDQGLEEGWLHNEDDVRQIHTKIKKWEYKNIDNEW